MKTLSKFRGCLLGGAIGDALGYAVEFMSEKSIFEKYGKNGITSYELINGVAEISDDTQMTLFTANGLLLGFTRGLVRGIIGDYSMYIAGCYKEWLWTQRYFYPLKENKNHTWLVNVPELFSSRAPGFTCMSAIEEGCNGTIENPINDSKGCGGVMRVAPIGLYSPYTSVNKNDMLGARVAALTHGHELGYISAAALVHIINLIVHSDYSLRDAVKDSISTMQTLFKGKEHLCEFTEIMNKAIALSESEISELEAIKELGEGWVAEECLAIAVYCSLKHENDFEKAIICSVNHSGDSDSTGAVTGNILGAYLGVEAIDKKFLENLELKDVICEIADDLFNDVPKNFVDDENNPWLSKYYYANYTPKIT